MGFLKRAVAREQRSGMAVDSDSKQHQVEFRFRPSEMRPQPALISLGRRRRGPELRLDPRYRFGRDPERLEELPPSQRVVAVR
jgi:hypothetical protein